MIKEEMKIGPKGQVVIPKLFRKTMGFYPGSTVVFELEGNKLLIERPEVKTEEIFAQIAKSGKSVKELHPHEAYEEELEERWKRITRGRK